MKELQGLEKVIHIELTIKGEVKKLSLIAHVLDEEERIQRDRMLVKLAGSVPYDELPLASRLRLWALANVRMSFKDIPAWFNDLLGTQEELLFSIFKEVDALEQSYFCRHLAESENAEGTATFSITTKPLPTTFGEVPK
jgi:hypothetical protein